MFSYCIINFRIDFNHGESYIDSPDWIKNKKTNFINEKDNVFNTL